MLSSSGPPSGGLPFCSSCWYQPRIRCRCLDCVAVTCIYSESHWRRETKSGGSAHSRRHAIRLGLVQHPYLVLLQRRLPLRYISRELPARRRPLVAFLLIRINPLHIVEPHRSKIRSPSPVQLPSCQTTMKETWWTAASRYLGRRNGTVPSSRVTPVEMEQRGDSSQLTSPRDILVNMANFKWEASLTRPVPVARPNPRRLPSDPCGPSPLRNEIQPEEIQSNAPNMSGKNDSDASLPLPVTESIPQRSRWDPRRWPSLFMEYRLGIFALMVPIFGVLATIGWLLGVAVVHHRTKHAGDGHTWPPRAVVPFVEQVQLLPSLAVTPESFILAPSSSTMATVAVTATAGAIPRLTTDSSMVRRGTFLTSARLPTASAINCA